MKATVMIGTMLAKLEEMGTWGDMIQLEKN